MRIIVNPKAGRGSLQSHLRTLKSYIAAQGLDCEFVETNYPGHAIELAREAESSGFDGVVAVGGDGTVSEVVRGLAGSQIRIGIIAVGTGNDVARSFQLPINQPVEAFRVIEQGFVFDADIGIDGRRAFISVVGVGFPTEVAERANRMRLVRGPAAFFLATYRSLVNMKPVPMTVELDDTTFEGSFTSVMVQNTPYTGGGLLIAPDASLNDGKLDVLLVGDIGRLDLMLNFPSIYKGKHLSHPKFNSYRSSRVRITSPYPLSKMFDGDIGGALPVDAKALARNVKIFARPDFDRSK